jgi:DNA polymerase-3 subunit epsilon
MGEMVGLAASVTGIECATALEAEVRELRLIAEHKPKYNRRSRFPERVHWVKVTVEPWPRLSLVRQVLDDGAEYLGPFGSKRVAERAVAALHETFPVRQCSGRMARRPSLSPCALGEMGKCLSPCDGSVGEEVYAGVVSDLRSTLVQAPDPVIAALSSRMTLLSADERYEEAGTVRDRLAAFIRSASRTQRLRGLTRCSELVAARRDDDGRWAVHVVRHGRLAAAGVIPPGAHAGEWVRQLRASAETVEPGPGPTPAATAEESEKVLRWLESEGVRLVHVEGEWTSPLGGARKHLRVHDAVNESRANLVPFEDRRSLRPVHQPVR